MLQAAEKQGSLDEVLHQTCARDPAVPRHEAYDHVSKQLRALFALAFWRSLLSSSVAGCWAEMEPAFGTGRVMGGNVSDSDVHRVQGKLAVLSAFPSRMCLNLQYRAAGNFTVRQRNTDC